jgi:hypothetical protein
MSNQLIQKGLCSHCKNFKTLERYTLCRRCCKFPEVRLMYRPKDDDGRPLKTNEGKSIKDKSNSNSWKLPLPPPTNYMPGTVGKFLELCWRSENGYSLWNPKDAYYGMEFRFKDL